MMRGSIFQMVILPAVIIAAGFAAAFGLSDLMTNDRPQMPENYADADLNVNGSRMKGFAFGAEGLIADWYWMRSLQYIGDKIITSKTQVNIDDLRDLNPRLLYPFLNNATDLDPHFIEAYSYGAVVLPAIDPEKAIAITEKGIANNPNEWRLYQYLGFIYWKLGRYDEAAGTYEKGASVPGAKPFMKLMAASMKNEGGSRATARAIYSEMRADSDDEQVQIAATRHLQQLDSLDERDAIRSALQSFTARSGRCAKQWSDILPLLRGMRLPSGNDFRLDAANNLVDPSGAPYILDKERCDVLLDAASTKLPLR